MTEPDYNTVAAPGGSAGSKLAKLVADATVYSKQRMAQHTVDTAVKAFTDATNHVSDEVRGVFGDVFKIALDSPDMPEEFKPLLRQLTYGRGQAWAWIAGSALGGILGGALQDAMRNAWLPVSYAIIEKAPNEILSPQQAAEAYVRGLMDNADSYSESSKGGIRAHRADILRELARNRLKEGDVLSLFRLGNFDQREAIERLATLGYTREDALYILNLAIAPLTPEQAADAVNRDLLSKDEAYGVGRDAGLGKHGMDVLIGLGGMPPSPDELAEAWRRGFITKEDYNRGIVQGPLRKEWFETLFRLSVSRMTTPDAADAVNQGHLTLDEGKRIAYENGLDSDDFQTLIETAGTPPGIDFAIEALNRGIINAAQFKEMFLESRIKNKYLPLLTQMRIRLIPQETVRLLYRNGVYSRDDALAVLHAHGFSPDDAAALISLEETRQDDTTKELTRAQIVDMYENQILSMDDATGLLKGLGYADSTIDLMMALADVRRTQKFINSAVTRVRSAYITGKIDETTASAQLDALGLSPQQRDDTIDIWQIDATTVSKTLTAAQIRQALGKNLITQEDAVARLLAQGYDDVDADLYLKLTA